VKTFRTPRAELGVIDAEAAATLVAAAADIALVLDESGMVRDVSIAEQDLADRTCRMAGQTMA
jgi:hypothetical protein